MTSAPSVASDLDLARHLHALGAAERRVELDRLQAADRDRAERVESLLRGLAEDTRWDAEAELPPAPEAGDVPERIGAFRIIKLIGEGGMGTVYLAEQSSPQRRVAIKIMRADWRSREASARFQREADVLARLEHPLIARIHEAGIAQHGGQALPYLAMEYVEGRPLGEHVRREALEARAILALVARIADAVQHAHLRGVVHRDLKPGNILVDGQGEPHILDFGIAHLTDGEGAASAHLTQTGQMIGTLQYMSPEQFLGDPRRIDGRTDVYALGVICFELLTGELPHPLRGASLLDAARIVTAEAPRSLSLLRRELRGDLELILAKALHPDLAQRYPSAADFAADLGRYLRHEPVLARAPSLAYRSQRFLRRHWLPLSAGLVILVSLLGGTWASWQAAQREALARNLAEQRAQEARAVNDFLRGMLKAAAPDAAQGREVSVREVIDRAVADESLRPTNPAVRARVDQLLGSLLIELGDPQAALPLLQAATRMLAEETGAEAEQVHARSEQAIALGLLGKRSEALAEAEAVFRETRERWPTDTIRGDDASYLYGLALYNADRIDEAEQVIRASLRPLAADAGVEARPQIDLRNTLGRILNASGRYQEALGLRREIMDWFLRVEGPRTMRALSVQSNYAVSLSQLDRDAEAVELLRATLPIRIELLGPDHVEVGVHQVNLGTSLRLLGEHQEALGHFREGQRIFQLKFGGSHPRTLLAAGYLADTLTRTGAYREGLAAYAEVLDGYREIGQGESRWALLARNDHALALLRGGELARAEQEFERVQALREAFADNRFLQADLDHALGIARLAGSDPAGALPLLRQAWEVWRGQGIAGPNMRRLAGHLWLAEQAAGEPALAAELEAAYGLSAPPVLLP